MSVWAQKRQVTIIIGLIILGVLFLLISYFSGKEPANCFDGEQNQNEEGIDCGGECEAVCQFKAEDVAILWARVVPVVDDVYSVVSMVENPNLNYEAQDVPYTFKLYDDRNILIYERKGSTFFQSGSTFPIFEHALRTGERIPTRATFELRSDPFWEMAPEEEVDIKIVTKTLSDENSSPKLTAVVKNETFQILSEVEFVALLFDEEKNLVNASGTIVERLSPEESDTIVLTWPLAFTTTIARVEIVPVSYVR